MISSPHRRSRSGLWFAAFTIISLLLLLASQTDPAQTLQSISAWALDPIRQTIGGIGSGIAGVFGTIGEIDRLRGENDELRSRLASAEQRIAELQEAAVENAELRDLLGLTQSLDMDLLPVRIISRDPSNFTWEIGIDGHRSGWRSGCRSLARPRGRERWPAASFRSAATRPPCGSSSIPARTWWRSISGLGHWAWCRASWVVTGNGAGRRDRRPGRGRPGDRRPGAGGGPLAAPIRRDCSSATCRRSSRTATP